MQRRRSRPTATATANGATRPEPSSAHDSRITLSDRHYRNRRNSTFLGLLTWLEDIEPHRLSIAKPYGVLRVICKVIAREVKVEHAHHLDETAAAKPIGVCVLVRRCHAMPASRSSSWVS